MGRTAVGKNQEPRVKNQDRIWKTPIRDYTKKRSVSHPGAPFN